MIEAIVTNYATLIDEHQEQKRQVPLILLGIIAGNNLAGKARTIQCIIKRLRQCSRHSIGYCGTVLQ